MSQNMNEEEIMMQEFKENVKKEAENLVLKTFPKKALELHALLKSPMFDPKLSETVKHDINIPIPQYTKNSNCHETKQDHLIEDKNIMSTAFVCNILDYPLTKRKRTEDDEKLDKRDLDSKTNFNGQQNESVVLNFPYGAINCNKHIVEMIDIVRPFIRQLIEDTNLLKMWVIFLIPRIEGGDNFGVSIQEETLAEIRIAETETSVYFDELSKYFLCRGELITKIAKYPHVSDYRKSVEELDEKEFINLRLIISELRNHYASLHDIVTKNFEKIKMPRQFNHNHMF